MNGCGFVSPQVSNGCERPSELCVSMRVDWSAHSFVPGGLHCETRNDVAIPFWSIYTLVPIGVIHFPFHLPHAGTIASLHLFKMRLRSVSECEYDFADHEACSVELYSKYLKQQSILNGQSTNALHETANTSISALSLIRWMTMNVQE